MHLQQGPKVIARLRVGRRRQVWWPTHLFCHLNSAYGADVTTLTRKNSLQQARNDSVYMYTGTWMILMKDSETMEP